MDNFQVSSTDTSVYDGRTVPGAEQQNTNFGRGGSPPTSTSSSSSSSSSSVPSFHSEQIHHHTETTCQDQSQMIAKQESVDYYYSNCNNPGPPPAAITASMNFMDHGTGDGNTFPSFYSLINANNVGRRADEMLSGHGYRFFSPFFSLI